jgi:hypothetical protein
LLGAKKVEAVSLKTRAGGYLIELFSAESGKIPAFFGLERWDMDVWR